MKHELDKPSSIAVGSFAEMSRAAGGQQAPNGSNALNPATVTPLPQDFAQAPMSSLTVSSDFAAFAAVTKEAANPASNIPEVSQPDLSKRSYPPVDTMPGVLSGGK